MNIEPWGGVTLYFKGELPPEIPERAGAFLEIRGVMFPKGVTEVADNSVRLDGRMSIVMDDREISIIFLDLQRHQIVIPRCEVRAIRTWLANDFQRMPRTKWPR